MPWKTDHGSSSGAGVYICRRLREEAIGTLKAIKTLREEEAVAAFYSATGVFSKGDGYGGGTGQR